MKKMIPIFIFFIGFVGVAIFVSLNNSKTTENLSQKWQIESKNIEKLEFYGTEQPIIVTVLETNNNVTEIEVDGLVSKAAVDHVKKAKLTEDSIYIPFSKKGFKLAVSPNGKNKLKINIKLGKDAKFKILSIDTWSGSVDVKVPESYNGKYDVDLNDGAKLRSVPKTSEVSDSTIVIDAYSDVRITK